MMEKVILYANDSMGRYIPKIFAESISLDKCFLFGIEEEDLNILRSGPDDDLYWDTWDQILNNGKVYLKETGQTFTLYQDGDLWLIDETAEAGVDHELWETE